MPRGANPFREPATPGNTDGTVAEDIKRDDAAMAREWAAATRLSETQKTNTQSIALHNTTSTNTSARQTRGTRTVEIKETHSTEAFIAKKREVGLMRLALANKEAEKRHLEEEMDRVEKRLRQQQEQLASTEEKFNNFLKHSNLEQDAAVRRAEVESKAKQERLIDIKKLSAQIGHVEQDMRKTEAQLELCKEYKSFMDSLTPPQWFYDVLCDLRVKDANMVILRETEEKYAQRAQELSDAAAIQAARRASRVQFFSSVRDRASFLENGAGNKSNGDEEEEEIPLETLLEQLQHTLEAEAQERQENAAERIKEEVSALPVEKVRAILDNDYPQERIPMYFAEPDQILDIFINVEEGNLFLIQNSQELEEELERVAMEYLREQEEMTTMVRQRHAQMESLATRIKEAQQRLSQLEERLADLESSDTAVAAAGDGSRRTKGLSSPRQKDEETVMKQEELKKRIELAVAEIFSCINQHPTPGTRAHGEEAEGAGDQAHRLKKSKGSTTATGKKPRPTSPLTTGKGKGKKKEINPSPSALGGGTGGNVDHADDDAGANMGPVEMLTIIENKVDEYHRYITNPENGVEESLIMSVIKARDKERRRKARMLHLAKQSSEREERNQRALERSQAPVVKHRGKPIMWRSRPPVETVKNAETKHRSVAMKEADEDEEFFR
ncbi:flagellar associated protein [Trypanosoma theileri]|uniref:Flagellar associated protein n=1 Tax=Trypanosoma theileri TaxID=67003 RepID=A0A1X0NUV9_9TRYP|nr:flagellar associated protein [Trypanosoma theileri]ORC88273.1 flagellar associated protein [Trypanosoma theileri]